VLSEISRIKNSSLKSDDCNSCFAFSKYFNEIFEKYKRALKEFEKIDFDDMILLCYELLCNDKTLLDLCRKKFRFILIDEYQDINLMQYKVIELLIGKEKNLFIVGDDDQSIYGFRGSEPRFMLEFANSFKDDDPKTYNLNINYRCGSDILNNALLVIGENKERLLKDLKADGSNGTGCLVPLKFTTKENQYNSIKTFLLRQKDNLSNISIICRTNSECMSIAAMLKEEKIPTNLDECSKSFLESESVMVLINYLKFSSVEKRREFFYKIMNKPLRYISREAVSTEIVNEMAVKRFYKSNKRMLEEVNKLFSQINMISHMRPSLSVRYIRKEIRIDRAFPKEKEQLDEFEKLARNFEDTKSLLNEMENRIGEKVDEKVAKKRNNGNFVKLLTMHGSKGLEFDMVWIPDLNEGIIPSRGAATESQIEEERRMLYVAMTRAKQALMVSFVTGTKENAMLPSRFLRPIRSKWTLKYGDQPSSPSSGSSTSSSNSTSSR
jgi:DNA helicase-2/ATP-dependent DNA helicase PcrA